MESIALVTQSESPLVDEPFDLINWSDDYKIFCPCAFVFGFVYKLSITARNAALLPICCVGEGIVTMVHANYAKRIMKNQQVCGYTIAQKDNEHMKISRSFCCSNHCLCYELFWSCRECECLFEDGKVCGRNSECCGGKDPQAKATSAQSAFYVNSMQADTPMVLMPIMLKS
jgi:hypothetical protein